MWLLAFTSWLRIPLSRHGPSIISIFVCIIFPKVVPESSLIRLRVLPESSQNPHRVLSKSSRTQSRTGFWIRLVMSMININIEFKNVFKCSYFKKKTNIIWLNFRIFHAALPKQISCNWVADYEQLLKAVFSYFWG